MVRANVSFLRANVGEIYIIAIIFRLPDIQANMLGGITKRTIISRTNQELQNAPPSSHFGVVRFVIPRTTLGLQGGVRYYKTHHLRQILGWCVLLFHAPP